MLSGVPAIGFSGMTSQYSDSIALRTRRSDKRPNMCRAESLERSADLKLLVRIQRPFIRDTELSRAHGEKQALCRGSVGADSLLELPD